MVYYEIQEICKSLPFRYEIEVWKKIPISECVDLNNL